MFGLTRQRKKLPAGSRPNLVRDERMIAWSAITNGSDQPSAGEPARAAVIVTTLGVWLPDQPERLGWHQIHKASWSGSRLTVIPSTTVTEGDGYTVMADAEPIHVTLTDLEHVPDEVRKRVTKSVAYTAHHDLPGGGVRVVGRRVPGQDGVQWHVRYDEGTDAADPEIIAATAELVAQAARPVELE